MILCQQSGTKCAHNFHRQQSSWPLHASRHISGHFAAQIQTHCINIMDFTLRVMNHLFVATHGDFGDHFHVILSGSDVGVGYKAQIINLEACAVSIQGHLS